MDKEKGEGIHQSAIVSPGAEIAEGVIIGPYSKIGGKVKIGADTVVGAHVIIEGRTEIGEDNKIYPFSTLGTAPQDVGYKEEDTRLYIGNFNVIREYVTINRATAKSDWKTVLGDNNYIMAYAHIAHDCILGDRVIMSNLATLGGHTEVGDNAILGGLVATHQFVRIGKYAFLGAKSGLAQDVPPYMITSGSRAKLYGVNQKGLTREGFSKETIGGLKRAYRIIWRENRRFSEGISKVREEMESFPELETLLEFFNGSKRGVLR